MHNLIETGKSKYFIVGSEFSDECDRYAASELQKYIYRSTDVLMPYFAERCEKRGPEIMVGKGARGNFLTDEELNSITDEGFVIKSVEDNIFICGKTSRGTLYGVYTFLEKFFGFRAFTKDVEKIDTVDNLCLEELYIMESPAFEYRDAYFRNAFAGTFAAKAKLNSTLNYSSRTTGGNFKFYNCHHSFNDLVPPAKYLKEHPEYYSLVEGERKPIQLCLSNPDVLEIATEQVFKWIEENPHCKVFSVAQNDEVTETPHYCTCKECSEVDEYESSPSGSVIRFVNKICEKVCQKYPDVLIHTFAYTYSRIAPKHVKPHPNLIVRLANIECQWDLPFAKVAEEKPESKSAEFLSNIAEWTKISDRVYVWDYAVNFANYLQPFPVFHTLGENIKLYSKMGVKGLLEQGNFSYGGSAAMDDLKVYIMSKLMWNPKLDTQTLIDEFTEGVYGNGALYIKEYIRLISDMVKGKHMTLYDFPDSPYITDEIVSKADDLFEKAKQAEEGETLRRIQRERLSVEYLKTTRILDDALRAKAVDEFAKKVKSFKITEIMERIDLELSFEFLKRAPYARNRDGKYTVYYLMK